MSYTVLLLLLSTYVNIPHTRTDTSNLLHLLPHLCLNTTPTLNYPPTTTHNRNTHIHTHTDTYITHTHKIHTHKHTHSTLSLLPRVAGPPAVVAVTLSLVPLCSRHCKWPLSLQCWVTVLTAASEGGGREGGKEEERQGDTVNTHLKTPRQFILLFSFVMFFVCHHIFYITACAKCGQTDC